MKSLSLLLISESCFDSTTVEKILRDSISGCYHTSNQFENSRKPIWTTLQKNDVIHRQVPLPMPCYDLLPLTEPALDPRKVEFRAFPARLS